MMELNHIQACTSGRHPARTMSYEELHAGLWERVQKGLINVRTHACMSREVYNYSMLCVEQKAWDVFTCIARGLILDPLEHRVLATPFPKFFNFGELSYQCPNEPFTTTNKLDGSLGIGFFHEDEWHVSTRGSLESPQAEWATKWLRANVDLDGMMKGYTYLMEIIYPENRIVVTYPFEGLILLSGYDPDGYEPSPMELKFWAATSRLKLVESHEFDSVNEIATVAKTLSHQEEGFVVRFASGFRLKIKGDEYCRVHRIVSRITPLGIWEAMMNCDDLDEIRRVMPEEFQRDFDAIRALLEMESDTRLQRLQDALFYTQSMSDKELGQAIASGSLGQPADAVRFLFAARKKGFLTAVHVPGKDRQKFFRTFRPTGNKLAGYSPTTMMNRFVQESDG